MLPSKPSFIIGMNVFREVWTAHMSLDSLGTSPRAQTPRFNTLGFV
jgi:hypothetical protein